MIRLYYTFSNPESDDFITASLKSFTDKDSFIIKRTKNGKPFTEEVFFSLSHTDGLTVCAVSYDEVGVDCEKVRAINNKEKILAKFIKKTTENLSDSEFFKQWTAFESRVKLFGEGICKFPSINISVVTKTFEFNGFIISVSSKKDKKIEKENLYGSF